MLWWYTRCRLLFLDGVNSCFKKDGQLNYKLTDLNQELTTKLKQEKHKKNQIGRKMDTKTSIQKYQTSTKCTLGIEIKNRNTKTG